LHRFCANLQKPEVIQPPLPRSPCGRHRIGVWRAAASVTSKARTVRAAAKNTSRAAPHSRRNAASADGTPSTKLQIDDLGTELIADFLTHIEMERRNGARPKLRANKRFKRS
jgi:hypothetical protein